MKFLSTENIYVLAVETRQVVVYIMATNVKYICNVTGIKTAIYISEKSIILKHKHHLKILS